VCGDDGRYGAQVHGVQGRWIKDEAFILPIRYAHMPLTSIDRDRTAHAQDALMTNRQKRVIRDKVDALPPVLSIGGEVGGIVVIAADGVEGEITHV